MKITQKLLENIGYYVLTAGTPHEAIELVKTYPGEIDLLLSDVVMPDMNGYELARLLSSIRPNLRTLFMSGYAEDVRPRCDTWDSAEHFISKPFSKDKLIPALYEAFA